MKQEKTIKVKFNEFIETGALDNNEFQEYEVCIIDFDNKIIKKEGVE